MPMLEAFPAAEFAREPPPSAPFPWNPCEESLTSGVHRTPSDGILTLGPGRPALQIAQPSPNPIPYMKLKNLLPLALLVVTPMAFVSCDGEAENAGEEVDEMVDDAGDAMDDAADEVEDAVE